jgi:hypothetical protein
VLQRIVKPSHKRPVFFAGVGDEEIMKGLSLRHTGTPDLRTFSSASLVFTQIEIGEIEDNPPKTPLSLYKRFAKMPISSQERVDLD